MAAPITSDQQADLASYKDIIQYLTAIINTATIGITPANITKMNEDIGQALTNINEILLLAEPTPV